MAKDPDPNALYRVLEQGFEFDSPEAIAKWRESRKRNFPSSSNIQRKQIKKLGSGEPVDKFLPKRFNAKLFRYALKEEKHHGRHNQNYRPQHSFHNPSSAWVNHRLPPNKSEVVLLQSFYDTVRMDSAGNLIKEKLTIWDSRSTKEVVEDDEQESTSAAPSVPEPSITDDEDELPAPSTEPKKSNPVPVSSQCQTCQSPSIPMALEALAGYGTNSDLEDGEIEEEDASENVKMEKLPTKSSQSSAGSFEHRSPNNPQAKTHCENVRGERPVTNQEREAQTVNKNNRPRRRRKRNPKSENGISQRQEPPKRNMPQNRMRRTDRQPTLLARLLDDEICEERNAVLGVCRFLVEHNFLKGMESSVDMTMELLDCIRAPHVPNEESIGQI